MSLQDKVAIITGASSGIGAALAILMIKEGACVTIVGRNVQKLNKTLTYCNSIQEEKTLLVIADIAIEECCENIIKETLVKFEKLDILVNNAGVGRLCQIIDKNCLNDYDIIMRTNVRSVIHLTHLAIPHLMITKGNIVNISSVVATRCIEHFWAYCTSKAALDHFSRCMAMELGCKGIRVNTVNPGPVYTDFHANMGLSKEQVENHLDDAMARTALGRVSDAEEIAKVVMFICCDDAKAITGASVYTDNGFGVK